MRARIDHPLKDGCGSPACAKDQTRSRCQRSDKPQRPDGNHPDFQRIWPPNHIGGKHPDLTKGEGIRTPYLVLAPGFRGVADAVGDKRGDVAAIDRVDMVGPVSQDGMSSMLEHRVRTPDSSDR